MKPLESELRSALARKDPPNGFAERVLARTIRQRELTVPRRPLLGWFWGRTGLGWAAAVILAFVLTLGFAKYHQRREGERAKARVMLALQIASRQLNGTLEDVVQINTPQGKEHSGKRSLEDKEPLL
jgi:hypothetical protein